jgi:hypothetical protein
MRIVGAFFPRLIARHLYVTAKKDSGKPVIRIAALEAEEPGTESETENIHAHIEKACSPKVAKFVDQNHDPDQNQQPNDIVECRHNRLNLSRSNNLARCCPAFAVYIKDIRNGMRIPDGNAPERLFYSGRDCGERDTFFEKCRYCHFVRRI